MPIKFYAYLLVASIIASIGWYIKSSLDEREQLLVEVAQKEMANQQLRVIHSSYIEKVNKAGQRLADDLNREQEAHVELQEKYHDAQSTVSELRYKLNKHNLEYLAEKKPGLVVNILNSGTARVFKQLREETRHSSGNN